jgi:hypothetical protein
MKYSVLCLLAASSQARKHHHHRGEALISIGERLKQFPNLTQLNTEVEKWDGDILGLVDETAYAGATSIATEEQHVDVEFKKEDDTEAQATAEITKAK